MHPSIKADRTLSRLIPRSNGCYSCQFKTLLTVLVYLIPELLIPEYLIPALLIPVTVHPCDRTGQKIQGSSVEECFVIGTKKYSRGIKCYRDQVSQGSNVQGTTIKGSNVTWTKSSGIKYKSTLPTPHHLSWIKFYRDQKFRDQV
jgi:hypothetical protein